MASSRIIVVTGATRGLGAAMTAGFIERGHTVVGCGRDPERVQCLRDRHNSGNEARHSFETVVVSDDAHVRRWAGAVLAGLGPPDLLINNASIINANAPLWNVPAEEFSRVVDVNIKGVANVIRSFVPAMVERGTGVIVNFSSTWGRTTSPEVAPYCATKWAIEGLTKSLADELPLGMAAVPFNPGVIDTDMLRSCFGDGAAGYPTPEQWAQSAVPFILKLGPDDSGQSVTAP